MSTLAARPMRHFVDANVALSQRTERRFHLASDKPLWQRFQREAAERIRALPDGATVLDLGGGRRCVYAQAVPADRDIRLVAVDISAEELAANEDVTETDRKSVV